MVSAQSVSNRDRLRSLRCIRFVFPKTPVSAVIWLRRFGVAGFKVSHGELRKLSLHYIYITHHKIQLWRMQSVSLLTISINAPEESSPEPHVTIQSCISKLQPAYNTVWCYKPVITPWSTEGLDVRRYRFALYEYCTSYTPLLLWSVPHITFISWPLEQSTTPVGGGGVIETNSVQT